MCDVAETDVVKAGLLHVLCGFLCAVSHVGIFV